MDGWDTYGMGFRTTVKSHGVESDIQLYIFRAASFGQGVGWDLHSILISCYGTTWVVSQAGVKVTLL